MAYLKELMVISCLLAFAMADTAVKMTASPEEIRPLLTRNLDLKCAFDDREGDDRVLFVRMSKQSAAGRPVKELVSMNENSEIQVSNPSTDVRYSGEIFGKGKAYLSGEWHVVPEGLGGIYECKVTVMGRRGETVEHIGVVRVKEEAVTLGVVVEELEKSAGRRGLTMKFTQTDTFKDDYYLIYHYEVNSAGQAEKLCQLQGGYLAELNDYDEWAFLQQYMLKVGTKGYYYISGRRNKANNKFYWPRIGKSLTAYVNWGTGQPNNWHGHQDCLALDKQFDWKVSDMGCILDLGFVCKMSEA